MIRRVTTAAVLVLLAAGCGTAENTSSAPTTASGPKATLPIGIPTATGTAGDERAYVAALTGIDPGLTVNVDRAVRRGRNVCQKVASDGLNAKTTDYVWQEFDGGNASVDTAKATRILAATRQLLCGSAG